MKLPAAVRSNVYNPKGGLIAWNAKLVHELVGSMDSNVTIRTIERALEASSLLPSIINHEQVRDEFERPLKLNVQTHLESEAKRKRITSLFLQEFRSEDGLLVLFANDGRGGRRWVYLESNDSQSELKQALEALAEDRNVIFWPHGKITSKTRALQSDLGSPKFSSTLGKTIRLGLAAYQDPSNSFKSSRNTLKPKTVQSLNNLDRLEADSIHILREVVAQADNPGMLFSLGKDSCVMLHLAKKAFYPSPPPFPLIHVDTRWKFQAMYEFRDSIARTSDMDMIIHINPEAEEKNINPFDHGSELHTHITKTEGLKQVLKKHKIDIALGGARRDEEKSRAKERVFSVRSASQRWDPKKQRPELWDLYNGYKEKNESIRVFPLSDWTELDIWQYIYREEIPIIPLYFADYRPVVERDGILMLVDDDRIKLYENEKIEIKKVRFRTLGCFPLTGAIESDADDLPSIVLELLQSNNSEREGRIIDSDSNASMEKKKQRGIFLMSQIIEKNSAINNVRTFIANQAELDLLRFITCGSVDDGKSTLIGRMLYEAQSVFDDQIASLKSDSKKVGTQGDQIDFALLVDGLAAEREQGITIDVAYRYFNTDKRKFIVADTPGHEQFTRNMVTGASKADVAVILVDATQGVLTQTKRHSFIASLLGIKHIALAVNKMDLENFNEDVFTNIVESYEDFASNLQFESITPIPVSALLGDNIIERSGNSPWYAGPTLLGYLETIDVSHSKIDEPFRYSVQWVNRPNSNYRGYSGRVVSGEIKAGEPVRLLPSGELVNVKTIQLYNDELDKAVANQSVTLTLSREIDVTRGDVIVSADTPCEVSDQFEVSLVWMDNEQGFVGRSYWLLIGAMRVNATITDIKYKYNINNFDKLESRSLTLNDIGEATISLDRPIPFESYADCKALGAFVLVDRYSFATVGAGMINFSLRRAQNVHRQALTVNKLSRSKLNGHPAKVLWFTGLSGSGKSTIANAVEQALHKQGLRTYVLDGDNVRHGLNKDLGFTDADRIENIRRIAEVAKLMVDAGLVVLTAFISPFRSERDMARSLFDDGEFLEIHVDVPLEVAEQRDPKGLYKKARKGELPNFTGIDSAYENPESPEIILQTGETSVEKCVDQILQKIND